MNAARRWSYSSLDLFLCCSLAWFYRYAAEAPEEQVSAALSFGSAIHDAHKSVYESLKKTGKVDQDAAVAAFAANLGLYCENPLIRFGEDENVDTLVEKGVLMLKAFFAGMKEETVVDVDREFSIPVALNGSPEEVQLTGVMDLITESRDGLTVVDLKTAARRWSQADADSALQATVYGLAAKTLFPGRNVGYRFDVLTKTKTPQFQSLATTRGPNDFARVVELLRAAQAGVDSGIFVPRESWRCGGCEYRTRCGSWHFQPLPTEATVKAA